MQADTVPATVAVGHQGVVVRLAEHQWIVLAFAAGFGVLWSFVAFWSSFVAQVVPWVANDPGGWLRAVFLAPVIASMTIGWSLSQHGLAVDLTLLVVLVGGIFGLLLGGVAVVVLERAGA